MGSAVEVLEPFVHVDRVRFADLDPRGHLNNVRFLEFFEAARQAFIRHVHPAYDPTYASAEGLIVVQAHIDYRAQATFEQEVRTRVRGRDVSEKKFRAEFEMRAGDDDHLVAEGHNVMVGYDYAGGETTPLPAPLLQGLRDREGE